MMTEDAAANNTSVAANWNPVLISLVRRAMPNMMAYDVCGVQPMSGPTGLIFAMKSKYKTKKPNLTPWLKPTLLLPVRTALVKASH